MAPGSPQASVYDPFYRLSVNGLYPPFLAALRSVLARCAAEGKRYVATSGLRDMREQAALYTRGRTTPGMIVTNAKPGQSYHNFGLAVDFALDTSDAPGLQPAYDDASLARLAELSSLAGLEAGMFFRSIHDTPHIQWALPAGVSLGALRDIYFDARGVHGATGLEAVWKYLDEKGAR